MSSPSELSLDYKPNAYPVIQKPFGDQPEQIQKLEDFLARLEEERLKIEAFKRELPLCMQLLNHAMEIYRKQLETHQRNQGPRPVLEEFLPLSNMTINGSQKASTASSEKVNWMVSAQLWSPANDPTKNQELPAVSSKETERSFHVSPKLALDSKQRNGGAFLPFSKEKNKGMGLASRVLPDLALTSSDKEVLEKKKCLEMENGGMGMSRENGSKVASHEQGKGGSNTAEGQAAAQSTHRKARRCWSPDLHRRFVNALQMLGGSQVATPKQIRELMKVDGLTNDEVKSHLQKYRLHTRRPIPPPQPTATAAPQLVVLGGIWVPPEYATSAAAAAGPTIYGAHPTPAHFSVPHDFYPPPPPHHHQYPLHQNPAAYKDKLPSPDSELRSGGDQSESIEEEEDGEEREEEEEEEMEEDKSDEKASVPLESKDSDVALKFKG